MSIVSKMLSMTPEEFSKVCKQMSELIQKKKIFWSKVLREMSDEEFEKKVCEGSDTFVCLQFQNEKYFLGFSDEKPQIKVLDDEIEFPIICPKYEKICRIKKAVEKEKHEMNEEDF